MTNLKISSNGDDAISIELNGVEINKHVLHETLSITPPERPGSPAVVQLAIVVDELDIDLAGAVVETTVGKVSE